MFIDFQCVFFDFNRVRIFSLDAEREVAEFDFLRLEQDGQTGIEFVLHQLHVMPTVVQQLLCGAAGHRQQLAESVRRYGAVATAVRAGNLVKATLAWNQWVIQPVFPVHVGERVAIEGQTMAQVVETTLQIVA
ncbi:hypothetical protein D3C79_734800 [compost metagenome]